MRPCLTLCLITACQPDAVEPDPGALHDPAAFGPYDIGTTTLQVTDPRGKDLTIEVWYPALVNSADPTPYPPTTLSFHAVRDAKPAPTLLPRPLVGFSHGSTAIRYQSAFLTEHLASHGFVVVAPDHNGNTLFEFDPDLALILLERPDDMRYAIDAAIEAAQRPGILQGQIVDGPWAITGHSFGALTALIVGGGEPDYLAAIALCEQGGGTDRVCDNIPPDIAEVVGDHGTADARVVTSVAMSPFASYIFSQGVDGLANVRRPLLLAGQRDDITEYAEEILPVYEQLASPKQMLSFEDGGHYGFSDICLLAAPFFTDCDPEAGFQDIEEIQYLTRQIVTSHLKVHLVGDARYNAWLEPSAYDREQTVSLWSD